MRGRHGHIYMPENHMERLYRSKNPLVRMVHVGRLNRIVSAFPSTPGQQVLDAGCGEGQLIGRLVEKFPDNDYFGIDITAVALEKARRDCPYAHFAQMDIGKMSLREESFDVVICTEVLEHIHEYPQALKNLKRVLKRGGLLMISFPNETNWTIGRFFLFRKEAKVPDHVNSLKPADVKSLVDLELLRQSHLPFSLPFSLALGCLMIFQRHQPDSEADSGRVGLD